MVDEPGKNFMRAIRSFVCRQGRMSDAQREAVAVLSERYIINAGSELLDLDSLFGRQAPRILEIGFGMGKSLIIQAQKNPEKDYLGIEVHLPGIGALLSAVAQHSLTNVRVIRADAVEVLTQAIPDASFDGMQIFFPDPWPKRRHHKRRLIQPEFVELLRKKLKPNGVLHLATDWENYAQQMLAVLSDNKHFENMAGEGQFAPRPVERPLTKFELRGKQLGHGVWDLVFCGKIG